MRERNEIIKRACRAGIVVPAFNIPYLPMMEPVIRGVRDTGAFALISVARLEWVKFEAGGARAVFEEYQRLKQTVFPDLRLGLLHGRMKGKEKDAVMTRFHEGEVDILVSTSVIEVKLSIHRNNCLRVMRHSKDHPTGWHPTDSSLFHR